MADSNPTYDAWAKCKPGATTTVHGTTETMGQKTEMTMTSKLVDLQPDKAVIEVTTSMQMMGQTMPSPAVKTTIPKEMPAIPKMPDGAAAKTPVPIKGTETITVMGKSMDCQTTEVKTDTNGMTIDAKSWTCPDVPGIVKSTSTISGKMTSTTSMELVDFKPGS